MNKTNLAFRKIKKNQYYFIPGSVFCKKAYIVSYKEKLEIEDVINKHSIILPTLIFPIAIGGKRHLLFSGLIVFLIGLIIFINIKLKIRSIISNKQVHIVKPTGPKASIRNLAHGMDLKELTATVIGLILISAFLTWFILSSNTNNFIKFIMFLADLSVLSICTFILIYFIKDRK